MTWRKWYNHVATLARAWAREGEGPAERSYLRIAAVRICVSPLFVFAYRRCSYLRIAAVRICASQSVVKGEQDLTQRRQGAKDSSLRTLRLGAFA